MKYLALIVLALVAFKSYAQPDDNALDSLKSVWTKELKAEMNAQNIGAIEEDGWSDFADSVLSEYAKDTFLLNGIVERQIDFDQSTHGMCQAMFDFEAGYDALLNKYYKLLLGKLATKEDKELLRSSQRNWVALRDSERELSSMLTLDKYSGGGTIQRLFYADWYADFTRHRVEELIDYLARLQ